MSRLEIRPDRLEPGGTRLSRQDARYSPSAEQMGKAAKRGLVVEMMFVYSPITFLWLERMALVFSNSRIENREFRGSNNPENDESQEP